MAQTKPASSRAIAVIVFFPFFPRTTGCNQGGCSPGAGTLTDMVYGTGRKPASVFTNCGGYSIYTLGSCAC